MKRNGFTLIELLAVIVILAIIALIATPIITRVIEQAKVGAAERSADNYVRAVETQIVSERLDGIKVSDGIYAVDNDGNLCPEGETCTTTNKVIIDFSGTKPVGSKIIIEDKKVTEESLLLVDDYLFYYKDGKLTASLVNCTLESGTAYAVGSQYTCDPGDGESRTFYVLESGTSQVSLIMSDDIAKSEWVSQADYTADGSSSDDYYNNPKAKGPITLLNTLSSATSNWTVPVSLPTVQQITNVSGITDLTESAITIGSSNSWLYSTITSLEMGYWTSSSIETSIANAWMVQYDGVLHGGWTVMTELGVRPVIIISKEQL